MIFKVIDKFTEIDYATDGLIENFGERDVEIAIVAKDPIVNATGNITLRQHNKLIYNIKDDEKLFIRACGLSGAVDILPFEKSGTSDTYTKEEVNALLNKKVNTQSRKGLSSNDFTNALKTKLDGIDLTKYQSIDAPALKTVAKTIEGAINELFDEIQALKSTP